MEIRFNPRRSGFHWHLVCMQRPPRDSKPDPNKIFVAAQSEVLSGKIAQGISILEAALSGAITANTFDASYHPLLIRLVMLYEAGGMRQRKSFEAEEKDRASLLLLQAQIVAEELQALPPDQIPMAVSFRLRRVIPGSTATGQAVTIPEFLQIVAQLTETVETAAITKAAPVTTAPVPTPPPPPSPRPAPRPAAPPTRTFVEPRQLVPASRFAAPSRPTALPARFEPTPGPAIVTRKFAPAVEPERETRPAAVTLQPKSETKTPLPPLPEVEKKPEPKPEPIPPQPLTEAQQKALTMVRSGQGQLGNKNYKAAIPIFQRALELDPNCAAAQEELNACAKGLLDLAEREFGKKQIKGAGTLLSQAESARPDDSDTLARMARLRSRLDALEPKPILPSAPPARVIAPPPESRPEETEAKAPPLPARPVVPPKPVLSPAQKEARKQLHAGIALKTTNPNKALGLFLEAKKLDPENSEIAAELESLFALYGERAQRLEATDPRAAQFACSQALRIKPGNLFISDIAGRVTERLSPDLVRRPSPAAVAAPLPAPTPPPEPPKSSPEEERRTQIINLLTTAKNNWARGEIGYATILDVTEKGILVRDPDNPWALCYCFLVRLAQKFPFLLELEGEKLGTGDQKKVSRFYGRLQRIIQMLEFFAAHPGIQSKGLTEEHTAVFYLVGGPSKVLNGMREAKAAADPLGDPVLKQKAAQRIRAEFEAIMALEIEAPEAKAAREAREQKEREAAKQQRKKDRIAALKRDAINYFIDHPQAKVKDLPGRVWTAIYTEKVFPSGIKEARRLAAARAEKHVRKSRTGSSPKPAKPPLPAEEVQNKRKAVIDYLRTGDNIGSTADQVLADNPSIYWMIYDKRVFPGGIREARAAAEKPQDKKGG